MSFGMKNGVMCLRPVARNCLWYSSIVHRPPIPLPIRTPTLSAFASVILKPDWRIACSLAATAYWMNRSIFLTSRFSIQSSAMKPLTSPAIRAVNWEASKRVIGPIPERACIRESQFSSIPIPIGVTRPLPVTTTRRSSIFLIDALASSVGDSHSSWTKSRSRKSTCPAGGRATLNLNAGAHK